MNNGNKLVVDIAGEVVSSLGPLRNEMIDMLAICEAKGWVDYDGGDFYSMIREGIVGLDDLTDVDVVEQFKERFFNGWGPSADDISNEDEWAEIEHCLIYKNAIGLLEVDKLLREEML